MSLTPKELRKQRKLASVIERLQRRREQLVARLAQIDAAIAAYQANPDLAATLDTIMGAMEGP